MVQYIGQLQGTGLSGALGNFGEGLSNGFSQGVNVAMAARAQDIQAKYHEAQQQIAERRDKLDGLNTFINLSPNQRKLTWSAYAPLMGIDPSSEGGQQFGKLLATADEEQVQAVVGLAVEAGLNPGSQNSLATLVNNGQVGPALSYIHKTIEQQRAEKEQQSAEAYRQAQLGLRVGEQQLQARQLGETIRHNQATEAAPGWQGSPIMDENGQPWALDKRSGQLAPVPVAGAAPQQPGQPAGLRMPSDADREGYQQALARGASREEVDAYVRQQGFDPAAFGSPGGNTPVAAQPGGFKPAPKPLTESEAKNTGFLQRAQLGDKGIADFEQSNPEYFGTISEKVAAGDSLTDKVARFAQAVGENGLDAAIMSGVLRSLPVAGAAPESWFVGDTAEKYLAKFTPFVSAALRKDTGAAITGNEWATAIKEWIPLPGDSPEVRSDKAKARQAAIEGMRAGAGTGAKGR